MKIVKLTKAETDFLRMQLLIQMDAWICERKDCKRSGTHFDFSEELRAAKSILKKIEEL